MAEQLNNLQLLDESGYLRGLNPSSDTLKITTPFEVGADMKVSADMSIDGDLTVAGDIVSRGSVNVVSKDPVIDLGLGDITGTAQSGGFTVQTNVASGFSPLTVTAFQSKADAAGDANFTVADASTLTVGMVIAISNAVDGENDGYYVVKSKAGGKVSIEPTAMNALPFAQTDFKSATSQSAKAYNVDLSVVLVADGSIIKQTSGTAYAAGTLVVAYIAAATKALFQANGAYQAASDVTLDEAYQNGSTITTNATYGDVTIAGTQKLLVSATNGVSISAGPLAVAGSLAVNSNKFTVDSASGNTLVAGTLDVNGQSTLATAAVSDLAQDAIVYAGAGGQLLDSAALTFDGTDFKIGTNKFTVASGSGNTSISGTLGVTGAASMSSTLGVTGNLAVNTDKFTVTASSGNTAVAGTLDATGDFAINTNKFTVAASSGNTAVAGTLGVTGAASMSSTLDVTGNLAVNTDKFTVAASSGNTAVAGTLGVTGAASLASTLDVTGDLAINTDKFTVDSASGDTAIAGTLDVTGQSTLATAAVSDLAQDAIVYAGAGGQLLDSTALTFDGTDFKIGTDKFTVASGSGNTVIQGSLSAGATTVSSLIDSGLHENYIVFSDASHQLTDSINLQFDATGLNIGQSKFTVASASGNTAVSGTMGVAGNLAVNTDKFTVTASSGNTAVAGTLGVTGAASMSSTLAVTGNFTVNTNKFGVMASSGNTIVAGTMGVAGDLAINTNKFTVTASSGNTAVAGTLNVSDDATFAATGGSSASPDFSVAGYAQYAGVLDINGSVDADVSTFDVSASAKASFVSSQAAADALYLNASAGGIQAVAAQGLSLQGGLSSSLSMSANAATDETLTIAASNSGAGMGSIAMTADNGLSMTIASGSTIVNRTSSGSVFEAQKSGLAILSVSDSLISAALHTSFSASAGLQLDANAAVGVSKGDLCAFDGSGKAIKADASAGGNSPSAAQEVLRLPFSAATANMAAGASGSFQTIPGTKVYVTFDSAPSAGLIGQAVYLGEGANAGKATLTAPMASNTSIWRVGYLASTSAVSGLYQIFWMPQYIGRRPVS
jgi:hypothetical protein